MSTNNINNGRRSFLKASALTSASAFAGSMVAPKKAYANDWGAVDSALYNRAPVNVLEINLVGAPSPWESFWVRKNSNGTPNYLGMDGQMANVVFKCPNGGSPDANTPLNNELSAPFATNGMDTVHFGPPTKPVWHLMDRIRMVGMRHDDTPIEIHEVALPYGLTGTNPGNARHAGPGVPIARRNRILKPNQITPHSYVINTGRNTISSYFDAASMAMGMHSGVNRPLFLRMNTVEGLLARLNRANSSPRRDDLLRALDSQYQNHLLFHADPSRMVRSRGYTEYNAALEALFNASDLQNILPDAPGAGDPPIVGQSAYCVANSDGSDEGSQSDPVRAAIKLAASLLTHPTDSASHVLVADVGLRNLGNSQPCYDTHGSLVGSDFEAVQAPMSNLYNLFDALNDVIDPSGQDASKLNLDNTMIAITTEFGRESNLHTDDETGLTGREHNAEGYFSMLIGGPVSAANSGAAGWINSSGTPSGGIDGGNWYSPADFRAAVLLAAGVYPYAPEIFGTNDASRTILNNGGGTEDANTAQIAAQILGV